MKKENRILKSINSKIIVAFLMLLTLSSCDPKDGSGRKNMVSGKWQISNFGAPMNNLFLYIHEEKGTGKVTGRNSANTFTIKGKMSGYSLIGSWEDFSQIPPNNKGTFIMDFNSNCSAFTGKIQFRKSSNLVEDEIEGKSITFTMDEAMRNGVYTKDDFNLKQ